ncbi:MAG: aldolase/citrate lyase family protein [Acidobacteria bacterium]|nr:aldolase/citrate lyase family protein [Acidobacteriota bacterium]
MKPNCVRELLAAGKRPVGHMIMEFGTRGIAKIVEAAGVDFVLIDGEHSGFDMGQIDDMLAWFKATRVAPFVRVPSSDYHFIARVMDAGAMGVMIPNVKSAAQAKAIVDAMRYAPDGDRGLGLGGAHNDFMPPNPREYMQAANRNNMVICQIESQEALDNLDAISATPGVDALWVGHFDLTQSLGIVAEFHHENFLNALKKVVATTQKNGQAAGIQPGSLEQAHEWMQIGFNLISYSADHGVYRAALQSAVDELRG